MNDTIRTTRVEMTPAEARAFAAHLIAKAQQVEDAAAVRGTTSVYGYVSAGARTRDVRGNAVPVRLGLRVCIDKE